MGKRNFTFRNLFLLGAIFTGAENVAAQGESVVLTPVGDTYVRYTSQASNYGSALKLEIRAETAEKNGTATKTDFTGLMAFDIDVPAGMRVKTATLRLVTDRCKGSTTMNIYEYGNDFDESTANYESEASYVAAAVATEPVKTFEVSRSGRSAITDNITAEESQALSAWTNNIDLTDYVKAHSGRINLMLTQSEDNVNQNCFFTKESEGVVNEHIAAMNFTAAEVAPQLTVVYEVDGNTSTSTTTCVADTWVRQNNTSDRGASTELEIHSQADNNFYGLMTFSFPAEALTSDYEIASATLRLVAERVKGDRNLDIYAYGNLFSESTTYADEESYITAALEASPIASIEVKGGSGALTSQDNLSESYATVDAWVNEIDVTDYVKTLTESSFSILLKKNVEQNQAIKFFTKEATSDRITNPNVTASTFTTEAIVPQLTVVYTKNGATGITSVNKTVVDSDAIYNLQGVRMNANGLTKGIYIKGGKKIIVK